MNAIEKFGIPDGVQIVELKSACAILIHDTFFQGRRKVMRGLEEHLVNRLHDTDHDFINGTYVYEVITVDRDSRIYIKFDPEWVTFGSKYLY